jgi:hypothetical protein
MTRRIRRCYPGPVKIVRGRGQFATLGDQQLLKPAAEQAIVHRHSRVCRHLVAGWVRNGDGRETEAMKTLTVAAAMLALIAVPAHAQVNGKRHQGDEKKTDQPTKKIDEKAYKAALERIPEPKEKYDPWGIARPAEPARKPK